MLYTRTNEIYRITRLTGNQANLLGVSFAENFDSKKTPETTKRDLKTPKSIKTQQLKFFLDKLYL